MIDRSTDSTAAPRSRQRGFLLNPFRFGGGGGGGGAPFDYASFLTPLAGTAWLADATHYTDPYRTQVALVGDTIESLSDVLGRFNATKSSSGSVVAEEYGKRYISFNGSGHMRAGNATNWNYFHDAGSNAYICLAARFGTTPDPNTIYAALGTRAFSSNRGIDLGFDDTSGASKNNSAFAIVGGEWGNVSANMSSANGALTANSDHIIEYVKTGTSVSLHVDGVQVASATLAWPHWGDSAVPFCIGASDTQCPMVGRIYGLVACSGALDAPTRAAILADMSARCASPPT